MQASFLSSAAQTLAELARRMGPVRLMEVCGTHTVSIFRSGLRSLLPENVVLLSGPGCPVCVTDQADVDQAIAAASLPGVTLCSYGDMLRVPGRGGSLREAEGRGGDVRVVMSAMDVIPLALNEPRREFVFFAVGFETTTPQTALLLQEAKRIGVGNVSVLVEHKRVLPALELLAQDPRTGVKGFLLPGHVSSIIGLEPYGILAEKYRLACAVGGFEGEQILLALCALLSQIARRKPRIVNAYPSGVRDHGNPRARALIDECFTPCDSVWRGLGTIGMSGLKLRAPYSRCDARAKLELPPAVSAPIPGCRCGEVLRGRLAPPQCALFGKVCTPQEPVGPCMVSSEGSCGAWYRYGRRGGRL